MQEYQIIKMKSHRVKFLLSSVWKEGASCYYWKKLPLVATGRRVRLVTTGGSHTGYSLCCCQQSLCRALWPRMSVQTRVLNRKPFGFGSGPDFCVFSGSVHIELWSKNIMAQTSSYEFIIVQNYGE